MNTHHTVRLPMERKLQLDAIADAIGASSFSATISTLIDLARKEGLVGHDIPGVTINAFGDGIAITFDNMPPFPMSLDGAAKLAETIKAVVDGTEGAGAVVDLNHSFTVKRRGSGIRVVLHTDMKDPTKTWAPDVAAEFAALVARTIATT